MTERALMPTNDDGDSGGATPAAESDTSAPPATPTAEGEEAEDSTARRRDRLRQEIRAGVQRALKH